MKQFLVDSGSDITENEKSACEINKYILKKLSLIFNNDIKSLLEESKDEHNRLENGMKVEKTNKKQKMKEEDTKKEKTEHKEEDKEKTHLIERAVCIKGFEKVEENSCISEIELRINNSGLMDKPINVLMSDLSSLCKYSGDVIYSLDQRLKKNMLNDILANDGNTNAASRKNERWKRYIKFIEPFLDVSTIINLSQTCKFFYKRKYKVGNNRLVFNSYLGYNPKILYEYVLPRIYKLIHRSVRRRLCLDFSLCTLIKDITVANVLNQIYRFDAINTKHLFIYNIQEFYFDYCHHLTDKTLEVLAQTRLPLLKTLSIKCVRNKYLTCAPLSVMLKKNNWPVFTNFICSFSNAWLEPIFIIANFIVNRANNENHIIYHKLKNFRKTVDHIKSFEGSLPPPAYDNSWDVSNGEYGKRGMEMACFPSDNFVEGETFLGEKYGNGDMYENHKRESGQDENGKASYLLNINNGVDNSSVHKSSLMDFQKNKFMLNSETECSISQSETNNNFNMFNNFLNKPMRHLGHTPKRSNGFNFMEKDCRNKKRENINNSSVKNGNRICKSCNNACNNNSNFQSSNNNSSIDHKQPTPFSDTKKNMYNGFVLNNHTPVNKTNECGLKSSLENGNSHNINDKPDLKNASQRNTQHSNNEKCTNNKINKVEKIEKKVKELPYENIMGTETCTVYETRSDLHNGSSRSRNHYADNSKMDSTEKFKRKNQGNVLIDEEKKKKKKNEVDHDQLDSKKGGAWYKNDMDEERKKKKKMGKNECYVGKKNMNCNHKKNKALLTVENIFCMNILHNNVNTFDEEEEEEEEEDYDENGYPNKCRCNGKNCIFFSEEINFKCDCEDCPFSKGYKNLISVDDPYIQSHFIKPQLDILGSWGSKCFLESIGFDIYVKGYSVALKNENIKICVKLTKKIQEELYDLSQSEKYKNNNLVYLLRDKGSELLSNTPLTIETNEIGGIDIWTLPISFAISKKNRYLFYLVLKGGAKIDVWDYLGKSPLYIACENECKEFVEVLLEEKKKRKKKDNAIEYSYSAARGGGVDTEVDGEAEANEDLLSDVNTHEERDRYKERDTAEESRWREKGNEKDVVNERDKKMPKRSERRDAMCISPYGNTSGTHHVTFPFDVENGYIPLNIAIKKKNFAIVDMLVKNGEALNLKCPFIREYKSPLYLACENNISEIIQLLLENKADPNWCYHNKFTPILLAYNLNKAWVNHFLDAGAGAKLCDRHILTEVLSCAIFKNDLTTVQLLLKKYPMLIHKSHNLWSLPFIQASKLERINILKHLYNLKNEVIDQLDPNNYYSPIHVVAEEGNIDVLKFLLENNVNVNLTNKFHQNALHIACLENQVEVVHVLLQHHIDVNCTDNINGETPLMICIRTRNENMALLILNEAKNINYNLTNIHGETSLVYAIFYGLYYIADVLMKRGAEVTRVQDITGDKSYNIVCERVLSNRTCKKVLKKFLKLYRSQNKNLLSKKNNLHGKNKFYFSYQSINQGIMKMLRLNKKRKKKKGYQHSKESDKKIH